MLRCSALSALVSSARYLALSVLHPFILSVPYLFDATFLYHASPLLRSSSFLTLESSTMTTTTTATPTAIAALLFSVPCIYCLCASCACNIRNASTCTLCAKFLCNLSALSDHHHDSSSSLVIFHHASSITGCSVEISQPLWQLRLIVFFGTVELMPS